MQVLRHLLWSALGSLLLVVGFAPSTVHAEGVWTPPSGSYCPTDHRVRGTNTAPNPPLEEYFKQDWRLGPLHLPTSYPLRAMLYGYNRTGGVPSAWFLACYWQTDPQTGASGWWYPDHNGFLLDRYGRPVEKPLTLHKGQLVDLFGSGQGNFLAPAGTSYAKRAIPPSNLDEYTTAYPYSYHLYRVTEPFTVEAGPARPWFGQPGLGLQYVTSDRIPVLIASHHLEALN